MHESSHDDKRGGFIVCPKIGKPTHVRQLSAIQFFFADTWCCLCVGHGDRASECECEGKIVLEKCVMVESSHLGTLAVVDFALSL